MNKKLFCQDLKQEEEKFLKKYLTKLIDKYPNDADLGSAIRKLNDKK